MIRNFDELVNKLRKNEKPRNVAVVCGHDEHTLEAVIEAKKMGISEPVLIGKRNLIEDILKSLGEDSMEFNIVDEEDDLKSAEIAVEMIHEKKADFIMKGKIQTANLLKSVVDKEKGLRTGRVMSHMALHELKNYHKLLAVTDGGMNLYPTLEEKRQILENSVEAFHAFGYENPKVAVICAVEKVNPKMQETVDAEELKEMLNQKKINRCIVEGPISYDIAMNKESATIKGYESPVVEDADILVVPNIVTGNILGKALVYSAEAKMAGIILGAKVPIVLASRGSSKEEKLLSIVLSASAC